MIAVDKDCVGWSRCHFPLDTFDRSLGWKVAYQRALVGSNAKPPEDVAKVIEKVKEKSRRYFKFPFPIILDYTLPNDNYIESVYSDGCCLRYPSPLAEIRDITEESNIMVGC